MSRSLIHQLSDHKSLMKVMKRQGWQEKPGGRGHMKMYCPCGEHIAVLPSSGKKRGQAFTNYVKMVERQGCPSLEEE